MRILVTRFYLPRQEHKREKEVGGRKIFNWDGAITLVNQGWMMIMMTMTMIMTMPMMMIVWMKARCGSDWFQHSATGGSSIVGTSLLIIIVLIVIHTMIIGSSYL